MITYKGNTTPKVGDDEWYELSATTLPEDTEIHWRLFREVDGEWIKVDFDFCFTSTNDTSSSW